MRDDTGAEGAAGAGAGDGRRRVERRLPYPRKGVVRAVRAVLRQWWIAVLSLVGSALAAAVQALLQSGWDGLKLDGLQRTAVGRLAVQHGAIFWPAAGVLIALIPFGLLAQRDDARERRVIAERDDDEKIQRKVAEIVSATLAHTPAMRSPAPFDLAKMPATAHFVNRVTARRSLLHFMRDTRDGATITVEGMGGIGKSSLIAEMLREAKRENLFPDGIAVVLCAGHTQSVDLLRAGLKRFSQLSAINTANLDELSDLAQRILSGKRALVVLDDVEPKVPLGDVTLPLEAAGVLVLVAARFTAPLELRRQAIRVELLEEEDAVAVFRDNYNRPITEADENALRTIVNDAYRHTLAVVLAARSAAESGRSLRSLAVEFRDIDRVLDLEEDQRVRSDLPLRGVRRAFRQSYDELAEGAKQLFQALAVMPTADYGRAAARAVADACGIEHPEETLGLLARRALFEAYVEANTGQERIRQHPLLRAFAADVADPDLTARAGRAMSQHYLAFIREWASDYARIDLEYGNVVGGLTWAHGQGAAAPTAGEARDDEWPILIAGYLDVLCVFFYARGHWKDGAEYLSWGIAAAEALDRPELLSNLLTAHAHIIRNFGRYDEAEEEYRRALSIARAHRLPSAEANALQYLGELAHARQRFDEAIALKRQTRQLQLEIGDQRAATHNLAAIGHILSDTGAYPEAVDALTKSLAEARALDNRQDIAYATLQLGKTLRRQGHLDQALRLDTEALEVYSGLGELGSIGGCLEEIGRIDEAQGRPGLARLRWQEAVRIYRALETPRADFVQDQLIDRGADEHPEL